MKFSLKIIKINKIIYSTNKKNMIKRKFRIIKLILKFLFIKNKNKIINKMVSLTRFKLKNKKTNNNNHFNPFLRDY